jgi:hypothetical protein
LKIARGDAILGFSAKRAQVNCLDGAGKTRPSFHVLFFFDLFFGKNAVYG